MVQEQSGVFGVREGIERPDQVVLAGGSGVQDEALLRGKDRGVMVAPKFVRGGTRAWRRTEFVEAVVA